MSSPGTAAATRRNVAAAAAAGRVPSPGGLEAGEPETPLTWRDVNCGDIEQRKAFLREQLDSMRAETFIAGLVVAYLCLTVAESSLDDDERDDLETELVTVDLSVLSIFVIEVSLKTYAFGGSFLRDYWNALDAMLIFLSFVLQLVLVATAEEDTWVSRVASLRAVFRVFRILIVVNRIKRPQALVVEMWRPQEDVRADISSPVGKVLAVLRDVRDTANLSQSARDELDWVMHVVQTRRLTQLDREHKRRATTAIDADSETTQWLAQQFSQGGQAPSERDGAPPLRRASQAGSSGSGGGGSSSQLAVGDDDDAQQQQPPQGGVTASSKPVRRRLSTLAPRAIAGEGVGTERSASAPDGPAAMLSPDEMHSIAKTIDAWDFDVFRVSQLTNGHPLSLTFFLLFRKHGLFERFGLAESTLSSFASAIESGYRADNPYHNRIHAADVLQGVHHFFTFATLRVLLADHDVLAGLVAAGVHDFEHPGLNNAFQIATRSHVATVYNDRSVLENHHVAASFAVMKRAGHDIFSTLGPDQYKEVRESVIVMVLATDMGHHFAEVAAFKEQVLSEGAAVDPSNVDERRVLLKMALHCADVSNPARSLHLYRQWTAMVMEEFHTQGDVERSMSLKVSPFMDRTKPQIAKCQVGFIKIIVAPLYRAWSDFLVDIRDECDANLEANLAHFTAIKEHEDALAAAGESPPAPAAAAATEPPRPPEQPEQPGTLEIEAAAEHAPIVRQYSAVDDTARDEDD